jgi:multiple sugar transport system substrate-binding protein
MLKHFKVWALVAVVAAGVLSFASCGKKESPNTIHLSSWGDPQENEILQNLINEFQKTNPDVPVKLDRVPYGEYTDKLLTQFTAGLAPDVIFVSSESVASFYPRNLLENLTPYIEKDKSVNLKALYPVLLKTYQIHGNMYAMPRDIAPVCVVYYNKKSFDDAKLAYPKDNWTTDEFVKDCLKLQKLDDKKNVTQWGFVEAYPLPDAWIYDFGGRFVDNPYKPTKYMVDQPGFLNGVKFRADLMLKHKVMPTPASLQQAGGVGTSDMFAGGRAAMFMSGIWNVPLFRQTPNLKWDVVLIPQAKGVPRAVVGGSSGYGIVTTSKHKDSAWKLIAFLSGAEGQKLFAHTGLVQPALKKVAESADFLDGKDPLNKKMLLKAVDYSIDVPLATNWKEVQNGNIYTELDKVWIGNETAEEAIAKLKVELLKHPPVFQEQVAK